MHLEPQQRTVGRVPPAIRCASADANPQFELRREIGVVLRRVASLAIDTISTAGHRL